MEALAEATLRLMAPLLLAALGELLVERAGVVNIGIEGTMLVGAFAGFAVAVATGSPLLGVGAGALAGCGVSLLFAAFAVVRRTDQIVVGMAINLLALGATGLAARALYAGAAPQAPTLPGLAPAGAGIALAVLVGWFLARTRAGLRLRAVGDSARAADAEGVSVVGVRSAALVVAGALSGVAGASLSLALADSFSEGMTAGRGFIALAVVIFGRWRADGVLATSLFFGAATALQFRLQARGLGVPYPVFLMFPYLITLAVLALAGRGALAPADLGRPYRREAAS